MVISDAIQNNIAIDTFNCPTNDTNINRLQCLLEIKYQSAKTAVNQQPLYWKSVFEKAVSSDNLAQYDEALELYEKTAALIPNSWPLRNQLASLYISDEQYDKAKVHLNHSLNITKHGSYNVEGKTLRTTFDNKIHNTQ